MVKQFLVIEYETQRSQPYNPSSGSHAPRRQDGYYANEEDAIGVAKYWLETAQSETTTIAVVQLVMRSIDVEKEE